MTIWNEFYSVVYWSLRDILEADRELLTLFGDDVTCHPNYDEFCIAEDLFNYGLDSL